MTDRWTQARGDSGRRRYAWGETGCPGISAAECLAGLATVGGKRTVWALFSFQKILDFAEHFRLFVVNIV